MHKFYDHLFEMTKWSASLYRNIGLLFTSHHLLNDKGKAGREGVQDYGNQEDPWGVAGTGEGNKSLC